MIPGRTIFNLIYLLFLLIPDSPAFTQTWTFVKQKDGVYLYTRKETGDELKSFKGIMDVHSTVEKVAALVGNVNNHDWWDENLREIKVLWIENPQHFQYYLVYDVPWPLSDRDLVVDARVTTDPATKKYVIYSRPLEGVVPEKQGLVRIRQYWQRWTVEPMDRGMVRITLEGFVDPGGNVPSWLYNMVITETPLKVMRGVRERVETPAR